MFHEICVDILGNLLIIFFNFRWGKDEFVEKNLVTLLDTTYIHRDPLGVCLIIGNDNSRNHILINVHSRKIFVNFNLQDLGITQLN